MRWLHLLIVVSIGALALSLPLVSEAGYGNKGGANNSNSNNSNNNNTTPPPPPVDHSGSTEARKKVTDATAEVNKATRAVAEIVARLRHDFQQKPEWAAAQAKQKGDQATFDVAREEALAKLQKDPKYISLKTAKTKADAEREALQKDPGATPEDQQRVTNAVFTATEALTKAESDALLSDPAVATARAQLAEDNKKINALLAEFDGVTKQNADWQAATAVVDQKQQAAADARKALAAAIAQEAQAERDRQKQMAKGR
jgi:hypothetical protein